MRCEHMSKEQILVDLKTAVETWNIKLAQESTNAAIKEGIGVKEIIEKGLGRGMESIGERFDNAEIYLPQVVAASKTMEAAIKILEPLMNKSDGSLRGTVVMGTVEGDIHEIGKNVCCAMLRGAGYNVIDLGPDADSQKFLDAGEEHEARVFGGSALMTTTLEAQRELVAAVKEVDGPYNCIFGGAPCSKAWCEEIGADGYSATGAEIIELVKSLTG
jgi:methanogenic corrinoid protein MtbC1